MSFLSLFRKLFKFSFSLVHNATIYEMMLQQPHLGPHCGGPAARQCGCDLLLLRQAADPLHQGELLLGTEEDQGLLSLS